MKMPLVLSRRDAPRRAVSKDDGIARPSIRVLAALARTQDERIS